MGIVGSLDTVETYINHTVYKQYHLILCNNIDPYLSMYTCRCLFSDIELFDEVYIVSSVIAGGKVRIMVIQCD